MESGFIPLAAIERRFVISIRAHELETLEDGTLALGCWHGLAAREPVAARRRRPITFVVHWRKRPLLHRNGSSTRTAFGDKTFQCFDNCLRWCVLQHDLLHAHLFERGDIFGGHDT